MFSENHPYVAKVEALMERLNNPLRDDVVGAIATEHLSAGGKRLRARLALSVLQAVSEDVERGLGWAAACELFHNATLIHDDIQDGDRVRRGQPAVWVTHGFEQGINAGDLLFLTPFSAVMEVGASAAIRLRLCEGLASQGAQVIRGQGLEFQLRTDLDPTIEKYLLAVRGKTSALFALPVWGALQLASQEREGGQSFVNLFNELGVAFQLQDDVLDLYGDKGRGRVGDDIREGKVSALVAEHIQSHPEDKDWIFKILKTRREETRDDDVHRLIEHFSSRGTLKSVLERMNRLRKEAFSALPKGGEEELHQLAEDFWQTLLVPIEPLWRSTLGIGPRSD